MKRNLVVLAFFTLAACGNSNPSSNPINPNSSNGSGAPSAAPGSGAQVFVVNGGDSTLSVIDAATNAVASTYNLGSVKFPHHISISPDQSTLMVAVPGVDFSHGHDMNNMMMSGPGAVLKVNADTGAVEINKALPLMNHNAAYSPDGSQVWTSQMAMPGTVLVLDANTLDTLNTIPADHMPSEVTFSEDKQTVFVANEMTNDVYAIDAASKAFKNKVYVPQGPVGAWAGNDDVMYVDSETGKAITAIDAKTQAAVNTFTLGFTPGMAATAPDGSLWVTDEDDGAVAIFAAHTGAKTGQITAGSGAHGLIFSADGSTAYVTNQLANSVTVIDVKSQKVTATVPVGTKPNGLVFRKGH